MNGNHTVSIVHNVWTINIELVKIEYLKKGKTQRIHLDCVNKSVSPSHTNECTLVDSLLIKRSKKKAAGPSLI